MFCLAHALVNRHVMRHYFVGGESRLRTRSPFVAKVSRRFWRFDQLIKCSGHRADIAELMQRTCVVHNFWNSARPKGKHRLCEKHRF